MAQVGDDCIGRSSTGTTVTGISVANPATFTAVTDDTKVWPQSNMSGMEFGAFEDHGGGNYTCRGNCSGSNLSATSGACRTLLPGTDYVNFTVGDGFYFGCYFSNGDVERDESGGADLWVEVASDVISTDNNTDFDFVLTDDAASWQFNITEAGPGTTEKEGFVWMHLQRMMHQGIGGN